MQHRCSRGGCDAQQLALFKAGEWEQQTSIGSRKQQQHNKRSRKGNEAAELGRVGGGRWDLRAARGPRGLAALPHSPLAVWGCWKAHASR